VLVVGLVAILSAGLLGLTAWKPLQVDALANPDAGSQAPFDGTLAIQPNEFYDPPSPLPDAAPGTLLRTEEIADAPEGVRAWRILYLSQDNDEQPIAISAYYAEPTREPNTGTRFPLIALAHGTTGVGPACGMSQGPFTEKSPGNEYWLFLGKRLVDAGYAIVATDYEGMGAPGRTPYLLRKQAYDVLDSMRAAIDLRPGFIDTSSLGVIGHSEGGYVALTTADQAAEYAPELSIRGAVSLAPGAIPPLPAAVATLVSQTGSETASPRSGYITTLSQSWLANYPDLMTPEDWYTPEGRADVERAAKVCQGEMVQILSGRFDSYFNSELPLSVVQVAAENIPLKNTTEVPLLIQQGLEDTGVVPQVSRALAIEACKLGDTVEYLEYPNDVHRSVQFTGAPTYMDWFADRFSGQPAPSQCREL
jgi:pimeloyl-ACP methyl ester carboxylesterase